jgi:fructose-1,6-bisphosphatase I/sedoheptulose-1,7-bisphosphatase
MLTEQRTLTQFLIEQRRRYPTATGDLNALILDVALACKAISQLVARGALSGATGYLDSVNVQGEQQRKLDLLTHDIFIRANEWGGRTAGLVSEELEDVYRIPERYPKGKYLLLFDPLDGSAISDLNFSIGSIFSILRAPRPGTDAGAPDFLQPGTKQVCAGYAIYGPATMFILTVGTGVQGFTLDPELGEFLLTHPDIHIPPATSDFAINASNRRFWEPAVKLYVDECVAGQDGPRGRDFSLRWMGCMVAEAHRILMRGGVYLYPRDTRQPPTAGRLRLLYEINPIAFIVEQAGGLASTGNQRLLDIIPTAIHQRSGVIFGAREEVERIERYHRDHNQREYDSPLFGTRGLFRSPGQS